MTIRATNRAGEFGVPGLGVFRPGETREVSSSVASWLMRRPEFIIEFDSLSDLAFRDEMGRVRFIGYTGPVDSRFGYGGGGIVILRALTRLGVQARVNPKYNGGHDVAYRIDLPQEMVSQLEFRNFVPQVDLVHCLPDDLTYSQAPRKIMWTMWETSRIPDGSKEPFGDWAAIINANAEHLVVPCTHNKEVFASCGVKIPITVLPYGLDTDIWSFYERPERETFTVVQYGDLSARKGPVEAIEAFQKAFPNEQNVRLILKTAAGRFDYMRGVIPEFRDRRIRVINATWERSRLIELMHAADAFIWLSRGEGFGLPPLQAALTGLPVIMTTHTGMAEYYNERYFYGVRSVGMSPSPLGGEWFEPDTDHAAEQLRKVFENRKEALRKGKQAAVYVKKKFGIDAFTARLGAFLETL